MKLLSTVTAGSLLLLSSAVFALDEAVVEVRGRDDAAIKFVYTRIDAPLAHIVFFPGGKGHMGVSKTLFGSVSFGNYKKDLSIDTRKMLAERGFSVAIVDTPSDRGPKMGGFRESETYGKDVAAVISHLKNGC